VNIKTIIGISLIVLGVVAFVYQGITYSTRGHEMNIGSLHMSTEQTHHIPLPPILGAVALIGGIALLTSDTWSPGRKATR
jgi:drug/metabolite transporter (DMT)-like permease